MLKHLTGSGVFSPVMVSNLYTMTRAAKHRHEQVVPVTAAIPNYDIRALRAKLVLEEALETIRALGFDIHTDEEGDVHLFPRSDLFNALIQHDSEKVLDNIIDGACDTIYVCTGLLVSCGVPDAPHLGEVNRANNAKFPRDSEPVFDTTTGKYLKPEGWTPPDHKAVREKWKDMNLKVWGDTIVGTFTSKET